MACALLERQREVRPVFTARAYLPVWYEVVLAPRRPIVWPLALGGVCHLVNLKGGSRCTYTHYKFAHACATCKGSHPRSACLKGCRAVEYFGSSAEGRTGMAFKCG